jgi:hypothetical protein
MKVKFHNGTSVIYHRSEDDDDFENLKEKVMNDEE